jgi:hypothetical protein
MDQTLERWPAIPEARTREPVRAAGRVLAIAVLFGLAAQGLLHRLAPGVNVPLLVAGVLGAGWLLRPRGARLDPLDAWLPAGSLAFAACVLLRADPLVVMVDMLLSAGLVAASLAAFGGQTVTRRSLAAIVRLGWSVGLAIGLAGAWLVADARPWSAPMSRLRSVAGPAAPVIRGLLLALPLVLVFAAIFAAADAVFDQALRTLFDWSIELGEVPERLLFALVVAWLVGGGLVVASGTRLPDAPDESVGSSGSGGSSEGNAITQDAVGSAVAPSPRLGSTEAVVALVAVDLLFALFVVLQAAYLFGGRDTLAVSGLTYSEYARRGFVELLMAASLAGIVLLGFELLVARRTRVYLGAALVLVVLTGFVLVSSVYRLRLYQEAYGWTELRFYAIALTGWLFLGLLAGAALLVSGRSRWTIHALGVLALGVALAVSVVGPQRFVARQNVDRLLHPELVAPGGEPGLDASYLYELGDEAVPALAEALPLVPVEERGQIRLFLMDRAAALADQTTVAWPAWNVSREEARRVLLELGLLGS